MPYASQDDLEVRYPGWLALAGPRDAANRLDDDAIEVALAAADDPINRALHTLGRAVPLPPPIPPWVRNLAVDIAAYLATVTVLASEEAFADRRARYDDALKVLDDLASGRMTPPWGPLAGGTGTGMGMIAGSAPRLFGRGVL